MKVSVESANCLRDKFSIGETVINNVCNGDVYRLSWTAYEWVGFGVGSIAIIAVLIWAWVMVYPLIRY